MGGGGKNTTSTQQVQIPQAVLDRYTNANNVADTAASRPFQVYSSDPSSFVAPLNATQQAGVAQTTAAAGQAQPYYQAATGALLDAQNAGSGLAGASLGTLDAANANAAPLNRAAGQYYTGAYTGAQPFNSTAGSLYSQALGAAQPLNQQAQSGLSGAYAGAQPYNQVAAGLAGASAGAVDPAQLDIGRYMSPYLGTVLGSTQALLQQDNAVAQSGQTGNAIQQHAFGGDRAGIASANLARQQQLANNSIYSNILNSAYSSGLGAAQQQQGVGLGAAQANRSALGSAGQMLAGIGQQQYGQGTGTAEAQANLGQTLYGQGLGAGQAVQGLGQQVFGQGSTTGQNQQGLGQQIFGQGLSTAQQQAQIAQMLYGMGSSTSQGLAGLGAGSQAAGLQGAQAELGAGQVGQQTQQAGLTALYNQFLQQQSYPFQVAQFLANIAEGTGSLSGSTTTTTQPGGFFSDRRLKDDVREVGRTFDGQPIVTYKYKGDDATRMGLIAQDVEKKHPDAVGLAAGYRTVDYGKATDDAAKRGHFADGGAPILPGLSAGDMQALLAAQAQMYAPFSEKGGLYGGQASGSVRGGSSYVPQASLPVSRLTVAGGLAPQRSAADNAKAIADTATEAQKLADSKYGQKAIGWLKGLGAANDDHSNDNAEYRGGLVRAKKYATGGAAPYGEGLDIPDEKPNAKLQTAGSLGKTDSGMGDAKNAAEAALAVAKIAAMFAKDGGRVGKAGGGGIDDAVDFATPSEGGGGDTPWYLRPLPGPSATGHAAMNLIRNLGSAYERDQADRRAKADSSGATPGEGIMAPVPVSGRGHPYGSTGSWDAPAPPVSAPHARMTSAPAPAPVAAASPPAGLAAAETPPPPPMAAPPPAANSDYGDLSLGNSTAPTGLAAAASPDHPGILSRIGSAIKDGVGGYGKDLKSGDVPAWVSLLAGIGAAGTAPTVHPGVALAAGLSGGANAYMGTKKAQAEIGQTQAGTGQIGAHTTATQQGNAINYIKLAQAGILRADPSGTIIDPATGTHYINTQEGGSSIPGGAPTPTYKYLGPHAQAALTQSAQQFAKDSPVLGITPNEGNIATSNKIISDTYQASQDAKTAKNLQNEQAAAILSQARGGVLTQGAMAPIFQPYVAKFNSIVTDAGHPEWVINGVGDAQIADKLQQAQALAQTSSSGQQSYRALTDAHALSPSGHLDPKAAATLMAQNAVMSTRAIDQQNMLDEAKHRAQNGNYEAQDMLTAFNADNPPTVYNAMRDAVAEIYQKRDYSEIHAALAHPGSPRYQTIVNTLNAFGKLRGIPNFARVFTGE